MVCGFQILLQKMSPALRGEVATLLCGKWVNSIPFFHQAPTEFLEEIAQVRCRADTPGLHFMFSLQNTISRGRVLHQLDNLRALQA